MHQGDLIMVTITGDSGNNVIPGTAENDMINGLAGSDTLLLLTVNRAAGLRAWRHG
jgi:hypothetical protein